MPTIVCAVPLTSSEGPITERSAPYCRRHPRSLRITTGARSIVVRAERATDGRMHAEHRNEIPGDDGALEPFRLLAVGQREVARIHRRDVHEAARLLLIPQVRI